MTSMIDRRAFLGALTSGLLAAPLAAEAQRAGKVPRIGYLHVVPRPSPFLQMLGVFKEMLPSVGRVAVLSDPLSADQLKQMEVVNRSLGFKLHPVELREPQLDVESAFRAAVRSRAEGLFVLETVNIFRERSQIAQLALKHRLPTSFAFREYVDAGGLASYGVNFPDMGRRAAIYVDKILKRAKPADLPVEQATKFELVINLKTAKALGLTIPPSLLHRADQVIE